MTVDSEDVISNVHLLYHRWTEVKEDFDDFKHVYTNAKLNIQKVIWNCGSHEFIEEDDYNDENNIDKKTTDYRFFSFILLGDARYNSLNYVTLNYIQGLFKTSHTGELLRVFIPVSS